MVNLKNNNLLLKYFGLFLTFIFIVSCSNQKYYVTKIEGKKIAITNDFTEVAEIENFIKPYREKIDNDLNTILAYAPETLDKNGEWQTNIGNLFADVTIEKTNKVFQSREKKAIDICLLNHGGIRSILPKGNVTARNAYELMPFENSAIVIALKGEQILDMANHIVSEKKPHPISGLKFTIDKNKNVKNVIIQQQPLDVNKIYYVVTSDYLSNGGDNMLFFQKSIQKYDLEYKLRNVLIDYFKEVDTIKVNKDVRITKE